MVQIWSRSRLEKEIGTGMKKGKSRDFPAPIPTCAIGQPNNPNKPTVFKPTANQQFSVFKFSLTKNFCIASPPKFPIIKIRIRYSIDAFPI